MNDDDKLTDIQEQYNLLSNLEEHFRGGLGRLCCTNNRLMTKSSKMLFY